jgi:GTP-binding protein
LNPKPDDYNASPFLDKCILTIKAGNGGNGCVAFVRDKYIQDGPPNGGNGGYGGNVFIQAVKNCTSLNVVARKREYRAGNGGHGMGSAQGGKKGDDILLEVPVGTVVREIKRWDPVEVRQDLDRQAAFFKGANVEILHKLAETWIFHPSMKSRDNVDPTSLPLPPRARKPDLAASEPSAPIRLDLDAPMGRPMLLAAGAMGGYGNPHFNTRAEPKPKYATKGLGGMTVALALELKLVADLGLVGLPNAGKSTLLRALSNSRARVGAWAFTTLQPNIGTVVLDNHKGRPYRERRQYGEKPVTRFTIADIPGLVEDAHLNKGLGHEFLRHVERAKMLAFVIDLSAGDGVTALKSLWREVGEYQQLKDLEATEYSQRMVQYNPFAGLSGSANPGHELFTREDVDRLPPITLPPMIAKPWFVVATKADLPETRENFARLQEYVVQVAEGAADHPSGHPNSRRAGACVVPVSAIRGEGIEGIVNVALNLME